jgi:hemoglobin
MRSFPLSVLLAACLLAACPGLGRARDQAAAAPDKNTDALVFSTLREVINRGADLYNPPNSDYAGCWHFYEGALISVRPFLAQRPALQEKITKGLSDAYNESSIAARAFVLRKVIDEIRSAVRPGGRVAAASPAAPGGAPPAAASTAPAPAGAAPGAAPRTLWERLGGEPNVKRVVDDFVATAAADPKVNFFRSGKYQPDAAAVALLKRRLVEFISVASGGPLKYTGKDMKTVHAGMGITDEEFDAIAGDLIDALKKNGAREEDIRDVITAVADTKRDIVEKKPASPKPTASSTPETAPKPAGATTLWERLGGEKNVAKVVDDLFASAGADPKVNFFRDPTFKPSAEEIAALKKKVIELVSSVSGGPLKYTGKDMKSAHKGMKITDAEFDAFAGHLKNALEKNGATPEDVKTVMGVAESTRKDIVEKPGDK